MGDFTQHILDQGLVSYGPDTIRWLVVEWWVGESLWKGKVNFFIVAQCLICWQVNFQEIPSGKTSNRVKWRQASCCKGGQPETWVETLSQRLKPGKEICRHTLVGRQILFFTKGVFEEKLPSLGTEAPPNIFWSRYLSHVWVKSE